MDANSFVKTVRDLAVSKNLEWTSFRERRMYEVGQNLRNGAIDASQAIADIAAEFKAYNINRDDVKMLEEKLKK